MALIQASFAVATPGPTGFDDQGFSKSPAIALMRLRL